MWHWAHAPRKDVVLRMGSEGGEERGREMFEEVLASVLGGDGGEEGLEVKCGAGCWSSD